MKKLFLTLSIVSVFAFASCSASEETKKQTDEAQKESASEPLPNMDDNTATTDAKKTDTIKVVENTEVKKEETKASENKK